MKIKPIALAAIVLSLMFMAPSFLVGLTVSDFTHCEPDEYNPWADGDDDGDIDIFDVVYVASKYSTNGCATKTLNITNWPDYFYPPYPSEMNITNWPLDQDGNLKISLKESAYSPNRDIIELTVFEWTSNSEDGSGRGALVYTRTSNPIELLLPFSFVPIYNLVNITDVWLLITLMSNNIYSKTFDVTINNLTLGGGIYFPLGGTYTPHVITIHASETDPSLREQIYPGINLMKIHGVRDPPFEVDRKIHVFKVEFLIEYEYLA